MAINDLYTAVFQFEGAGSGFQTSFHYVQDAGTNDNQTLNALATSIAIAVEDDMKAILPIDIDFVGISVHQVTGSNEIPGFTRFQQPNAGTFGGSSLPLGGSAVFSWLTDAPNSKHNGRMYFGGVSKTASEEGELTAGYKTAAATAIASLLLDLDNIGVGNADFKAVTISRVLAGVPRVPPVGFLILSGAVDSFVKNQRRRITKFVGVGPATP